VARNLARAGRGAGARSRLAANVVGDRDRVTTIVCVHPASEIGERSAADRLTNDPVAVRRLIPVREQQCTAVARPPRCLKSSPAGVSARDSPSGSAARYTRNVPRARDPSCTRSACVGEIAGPSLSSSNAGRAMVRGRHGARPSTSTPVAIAAIAAAAASCERDPAGRRHARNIASSSASIDGQRSAGSGARRARGSAAAGAARAPRRAGRSRAPRILRPRSRPRMDAARRAPPTRSRRTRTDRRAHRSRRRRAAPAPCTPAYRAPGRAPSARCRVSPAGGTLRRDRAQERCRRSRARGRNR